MTAQPHETLFLADFGAWELEQKSKHEFVNGHVYALAGGTIRHARIAGILLSKILPAVLPGRTVGSDVLIQMAASATPTK